MSIVRMPISNIRLIALYIRGPVHTESFGGEVGMAILNTCVAWVGSSIHLRARIATWVFALGDPLNRCNHAVTG